MKLIKFVFTCFWFLILLASANVLLFMLGRTISGNHIGVLNLLGFASIVLTWAIFPYTVAPILHITHSPFKLFTLRSSSAIGISCFIVFGFIGNVMGALIEHH
jgi:hypothetical protein